MDSNLGKVQNSNYIMLISAHALVAVQAMEVLVVASCDSGFQGYLEPYIGEEYNSLLKRRQS